MTAYSTIQSVLKHKHHNEILSAFVHPACFLDLPGRQGPSRIPFHGAENFTEWMPFLMQNKHCQRIEVRNTNKYKSLDAVVATLSPSNSP